MANLPKELRDRYRVLEELGQGGFGIVLAAEDEQLGRRVAVKLLGQQGEADFAARFQREARVTASLRHPHVVAVYDYGVSSDGTAYILYELVEGRSLAAEVAATPPAPETVVRWGVQLAEALQVAHEAGVVHRDVKPGNVLLREDGQAVLCDFGIAHLPMGHTVVTEAGIRLGTPAYMAPEAIIEGATTPAADQFALASTLLEALTGQPAYGTGDLDKVLRVVRSSEPLGGVALDRVPGGLRAVLSRALARDPAGRFPDLGAMARALEGADMRGIPTGKALPRIGPGPTGQTTTRKRLRVAGERRSRRIVRRVGLGWMVVLLAVGVAYGLLSGPAPSGPAVDPPTSPEERRQAAARAAEQDAAKRLETLLARWTAGHRPPGSRPGRWRSIDDPEHWRTLQEQASDEGFPDRLRELERAFLDWESRAGERPSSPTYEALVHEVAYWLLPHLSHDFQTLHNRAWSEAFGGNIRLDQGQAQVPRSMEAIQDTSARIAERLVPKAADGPRWRVRVALWLAAHNAVKSHRIQGLLEVLESRLAKEDAPPLEVRQSTTAMTRAVRTLRNRHSWSCAQAREWSRRWTTRLLELPRAQDVEDGLSPVRSMLGLENSFLGDCPARGADRALVDLEPLMVDAERHVDLVPGDDSYLTATGLEVRGLWERSRRSAAKRGYTRRRDAARVLRQTFWLAEKLIHLGSRKTRELVPEDVAARAAWLRARIPAKPFARAGTEEGNRGIEAVYRGLRIMGPMPFELMEAAGEVASRAAFPGRTYLAGRLRLLLMETDSEAEREPMRVALDRLTKGYAPRSTWGCRMLRGEMWGNVHSEEEMRLQMAPELSFFTTTDTLSPFLAGAGATAAMLIRDCQDALSPEDEKMAMRLLQDGVRGRDRGARSVAEVICGSSEFPGPAWEELAAEDHPSVLLMRRLCR